MIGANTLVDSHCHIDFAEFADDLEGVFERASENCVEYLLCVGVDLRESRGPILLAEQNEHVYASVGTHPNVAFLGSEEPKALDIEQAASHPRVVAIGETGLDYYRSSGDLEWQQGRFRTHIDAAQSSGLPVIVHTRDAREDTIGIMREQGAESCGGVMHCFTEDWTMARDALDLGFYISISGIVTFKKAEQVQNIARRIPLDRLLVETDCPYLAPIPNRGKRNEPSYVADTARFLAELRNESFEALAAATTENFFRLFRAAGGGRRSLPGTRGQAEKRAKAQRVRNHLCV